MEGGSYEKKLQKFAWTPCKSVAEYKVEQSKTS